jgi:hypothetical protein
MFGIFAVSFLVKGGNFLLKALPYPGIHVPASPLGLEHIDRVA